jgi:hydroxymethylpyrimidine kinase/phosphomethylpyrimidine kinase
MTIARSAENSANVGWCRAERRATLGPMRAPRPEPSSLPCALAIAGLDPSGGAGIFADLRGFTAAGVWGCGALALSTVQSTAGMRSGRAMPARELMAQVRELWAEQDIKSIKIGALGSAANVRAVLLWLRAIPDVVPVVLDPVMLPSRGARTARLLDRSGVQALSALAARATLVTPNVVEAETLVGMPIRSIADAEQAARDLVRAGARAALVKGGHLRESSSPGKTVDVLAIGSRIVQFSAPRVAVTVHGAGCTLASLIAGRLAKGGTSAGASDQSIIAAVRWAKNRLHRALRHPARIGAGLLVLPL